jgi:transposase-like protein
MITPPECPDCACKHCPIEERRELARVIITRYVCRHCGRRFTNIDKKDVEHGNSRR